MAIRNEHDDYDWLAARQRRQLNARPRQNESDESEPPKLGETLIELAMTAGGFVGIILLIDVIVRSLD